MGIEKVVPDLARPRGLPAAAAAVDHRRADEPVHVDVDRRDARRRSAGVPPGAARQRPHRDARRPDGPRGAALHPLLGVPQRLPGLRAHRRARLRLGLPGPDRRGAVPAAHRRRRQPVAAVRLDAVRRLLRRLPGRDRHPDDARAPARQGRGVEGWRNADGGGGRDALGVLGDVGLEALACRCRCQPVGPDARAQRADPRPAAVPVAWTASRDLPAPPKQTFRDWWGSR